MAKRAPPRPKADPDAFAEVVADFRDRLIMSDEEFQDLESASYSEAFTVAGVAQLDLVEQVWSAVDDAIAQGSTLDDFRDRIEEKLTNAWGAEQPYRVETIFRTTVGQAYSRGRFEQMSAPAVVESRPYWRFIAIEDTRECELCGSCDGVILPSDHPWWKTHYPLLHHSCRCRVDTLSAREAGENVTTEPPGVAAADGFGMVPANEPYEPDLSEYPPELATAFGG